MTRELELIESIAFKAIEAMEELGYYYSSSELIDLIQDVHNNCCELDLIRMAKAEPRCLIHDITGIYNCYDEERKTLKNHFLPRYAKK